MEARAQSLETPVEQGRPPQFLAPFSFTSLICVLLMTGRIVGRHVASVDLPCPCHPFLAGTAVPYASRSKDGWYERGAYPTTVRLSRGFRCRRLSQGLQVSMRLSYPGTTVPP